MKIIQCPVCHRTGGGLHFKPARPGTRPYPYVKHYGQRTPCSISFSDLSQIEFRDAKFNALKSDLDPREWHKMKSRGSIYPSIDSYRNKTDVQKIQERVLDIIDKEQIWLKKCSIAKKPLEAFTYYGDIVQMPDVPATVIDLENLKRDTKRLYQKNNNRDILLLFMLIDSVLIAALLVRKHVIKQVPLETSSMSRKQKLRILKRQTRNVLPIFDPNTRDEALMCGFHGTQCPNCAKKNKKMAGLGSWRTDLAPDGTGQCICHACDTTGFEAGIRPDCPQCHRPFYDSAIREMIKTAVDSDEDRILTRCIYCQEEVYFLKKTCGDI
jgi:hypothetical protein